MVLEVKCKSCAALHYIKVPAPDYYRWIDGELIQNAMPYLEPEIRELLISGTCGPCFDKMFKEPEHAV